MAYKIARMECWTELPASGLMGCARFVHAFRAENGSGPTGGLGMLRACYAGCDTGVFRARWYGVLRARWNGARGGERECERETREREREGARDGASHAHRKRRRI